MAYNYNNQEYDAPPQYPAQQTGPTPDPMLMNQDPNAHYRTPPGYVLVPMSQLGCQIQPQLQPPTASQQPSLDAPDPPLPLRSPNSNAPPTQAATMAQVHAAHSSLSGLKSTARFPTRLRYTLVSHRVSATKELFQPTCCSPNDATGYEAVYRDLDFTDRKNDHATIYERSPSTSGGLHTRLAGSALYHRYWSNRIRMTMPYLSEPWEYDTDWVSDVGTCAGRELTWIRANAEELSGRFRKEAGGKPLLFVLDCIETNSDLVARIVVDAMQNARIEIWVELQDQKQLDEMVVVSICIMHRMRFKVKKDEKRLLKDEDWDAIDKFTGVARGAMNAGGGGA